MKKLVSLMIVLSLILSTNISVFADTNKIEFKDVSGSHWARAYIASLVAVEALKGYPDGSFKPEGTITAAEFVKTVVALSEKDTEMLKSNIEMEDIDALEEVEADKHWASLYMKSAEIEGYVPEGMFEKSAWDKPITREKMAVIMERASAKHYDIIYLYDGKEISHEKYIEYAVGTDERIKDKLDTKENEKAVSDEKLQKIKGYFKDYSSICDYCKDYVTRAVAKGIITGYPDGSFKPKGNATRAEASAMIVRLIAKDLRKEIDFSAKKPVNEHVLKEGKVEDLITDPIALDRLNVEIASGRSTNEYKIFKDGTPFQMKYLGKAKTLDYEPKHKLEMKSGGARIYLLDKDFKCVGTSIIGTWNIGKLGTHIFVVPPKADMPIKDMLYNSYGDPTKAAYFAWYEGGVPDGKGGELSNSHMIYIVPNTYI